MACFSHKNPTGLYFLTYAPRLCCSYSESPRNRVRPRWSRRPQQQQHLMVILSQKKTLVNLCQPGRWLAKVDLKHAYRSVGTHPDGWWDTGMSWCFSDSKHPTYLYDKRLPFGDRASPMVFHRFAQAISRMMARRGYTVLAYLDGFLFIEPTQRLSKGNFWQPVSRILSTGPKLSTLPKVWFFLGLKSTLFSLSFVS